MASLSDKRKSGFTLIEILVTIGLIGILTAIAVPRYIQFSARAVTSEAKMLLKGSYTAAKARYAETKNWAIIYTFVIPAGGFASGYGPEGGLYYNYVGNGMDDKKACSKIGCDQTSAIRTGPKTCPTNKGVAATTNGFVYTAWGQIDQDAFMDVWIIDTNNNLINTNATTVNSNGAGNFTAVDNCSDVLYEN